VDIGQFDMSINVNSAVATYRRVDHMLSLFFNGVFIGEVSAPASFVDNVIDWSTSDNIYVNQFHRYTPWENTHYHKISVYDKILTPHEIVNIYNERSQPPIVADLPVLDWNFNGNLIDSVNSIEFNNPFDIEITETYANINRSGQHYYLHAEVSVELLSQCSMSLMFRFKALPGFHNTIDFVFSTYHGPPDHRRGLDNVEL
jgi:hypothetical protein